MAYRTWEEYQKLRNPLENVQGFDARHPWDAAPVQRPASPPGVAASAADVAASTGPKSSFAKQAAGIAQQGWGSVKNGASQAYDAARGGISQARAWWDRPASTGVNYGNINQAASSHGRVPTGGGAWTPPLSNAQGPTVPFGTSYTPTPGATMPGPAETRWRPNWSNPPKGAPIYSGPPGGFSPPGGASALGDAANAAKQIPTRAERVKAWGRQPAGEVLKRSGEAVSSAASKAGQAIMSTPVLGNATRVAGGVGTAGLVDFAGQLGVHAANKAGLVSDETAENITRQNYEWYDPRAAFALAGAGVRALAYGAGRGLNAINSDWGITDEDVRLASKHGISMFDDKSFERARTAAAKREADLRKEIQQARDQGASERGAVVGTTPEAKGEAPGQLVVPRDENGNLVGEPYFNIPSIAPRLRDATAKEARSLPGDEKMPFEGKPRQTLDFGRLGKATFAYNPEREERIKESMAAGLYDQAPRVERAVPNGKGGLKPSDYALNPTNPEQLQQGIQDYETVERGTQAMRELRATRLGLSPEMLNAYDQGTPLRTLRAAETKRGIEAPYGQGKDAVTKQDLDGLKQAFAAALKGGEKKGGKEEKLPEAGQYFHETLKRLTGSEEQASRIMQNMLAAGHMPKDAAGLSQAVERHRLMSQFMDNQDDNPFDYEVVSGTPPGFFFDGDLTVANRKSGRQKVWDEDDVDPNSYATLLRRIGLEP